MLAKCKKHKIFVFGCLLWDIICRPNKNFNIGEDTAGLITERPGGVAFNIAVELANKLDKDFFTVHLVSITGKCFQTEIQLNELKKSGINTKHLTIIGNDIDKYVSIETESGEIFCSVNSCNVFSLNESIVCNQLFKILENLRKETTESTFIFDGNLSKSFFDTVINEPQPDKLQNYFIPANFKKLNVFSHNPLYFNGFSLLLNLKEAIKLCGKEFDDSYQACNYFFNLKNSAFVSIVITDGANIACGIRKEGLFMLKPKKLDDKPSTSGAGDLFFANYIASNLLNPDGSVEEYLKYANKHTYKFLNKRK